MIPWDRQFNAAIVRGPKGRESKSSVKSSLLILCLDWICCVLVCKHKCNCRSTTMRENRCKTGEIMEILTIKPKFLHFLIFVMLSGKWTTNHIRNSNKMDWIYLRAKFGCAQYLQAIISQHQDLCSQLLWLQAEIWAFFDENPCLIKRNEHKTCWPFGRVHSKAGKVIEPSNVNVFHLEKLHRPFRTNWIFLSLIFAYRATKQRLFVTYSNDVGVYIRPLECCSLWGSVQIAC